MKKTLLLISMALVSATSFGQTVTNCGADGSKNTFKVPAGSHVYAILKDFGDNATLLQAIGTDKAHYTNYGEDAAAGRNLWNWQISATNPGGPNTSSMPGKDSFGVMAQYYNMKGATGWSGWGLNVGKSNPIDLSTIFNLDDEDAAQNAGLYFAIKQTRRGTVNPWISITDGNGTEARFEVGKNINVPADGNWYSVNISAQDLADIYGVDFTTPANKTYSDKNLFSFGWGGSPDDFQIDYAAFLYSAGTGTTGIKSIKKSESKNLNSDVVYNISGQRVDSKSLVPGLYIKNGKKFIKK